MTNIRARDMQALKRRRDFLCQRMEYNGRADTGHSYDAQEYNALDRVIKRLEEEDGEETEVQHTNE